ncbi:MAG: HEAT repeat domain-containing protein [Oligoflexia bacterium]|nr:HEAT repeat domain-containing protein [Oligoflexia bacterium]
MNPDQRNPAPPSPNSDAAQAAWTWPRISPPTGGTDRPSVQGLVLKRDPPDDDGDVWCNAAVTIVNANRPCWRLIVRVIARDKDGWPLFILDDTETDWQPSQARVFDASGLARQPVVNRRIDSFDVLVEEQTLRELPLVEQRFVWEESDDDGAHWGSLWSCVDNPGPTASAAAIRMCWVDAKGDTLSDEMEIEDEPLAPGRHWIRVRGFRWTEDGQDQAVSAQGPVFAADGTIHHLGRVHADGRWDPAELGAEVQAEPVAEPVAESAAEPVAEPAAEPVAEPVAEPDPDPWAVLDRDGVQAAAALLAQGRLDSKDRDHLRRMLGSADPQTIADGARLAAAADWRSAVTILRRHLTHSSPQVRTAATAAIGRMAGPSVAPAIQRLLDDPDQGVREAAAQALIKLG